MDRLRIFNAKWASNTAGPSPFENRRTEIFLAGCQKAAAGNPCRGCFNAELWQKNVYVAEASPEDAFANIKKFAPSPYITFVGGEPLDQLDPLAKLCALLRRDGFHIIVITHFLYEDLLLIAQKNKAMQELLSAVDVLIDGEYKEEERIWDDRRAGDGLHDVIGSGNQRIIELGTRTKLTYAGDIDGWSMQEDRSLTYIRRGEEAVA